jgi:hypothetical protein
MDSVHEMTSTPIPYHPHLCDLAQPVSTHGCGRIRNGYVVICHAVDGMARRPNGYAVGTVGIWGIAHFRWLPDLAAARGHAAVLLRSWCRRLHASAP